MNQKSRTEMLTWLARVAFGLSIAGCSAASSTGGTGLPQGGGNDLSGSNQGASSATGSASGDQSGGSSAAGSGSSVASTGSSASGSLSSGSGTTTGSSGTSTGGSSGSGAMADGGSASMPSRGCGQGTSCTPADDLAAPAAADGFQFVLKPGQVTIQPNQEAYYCYYKTIPGNAAIEVGAFQSWMSKGASHHFITFAGGAMPDGTLQTCSIGNGQWVYATSVAGQIIELKMPDSVGLQMNAGAQFILNMHFINPGTAPISPTLKLNILYAKNVMYQAGTMVSFNAGINIPPGGTQTVRGSCSAAPGSKFFAMTTHTHKHATATDVNYVSGGQSMNIVHTTDWESPDVGLWYAPNFLTVKPGDSFTYSCAYANTGLVPVTVGETAASNEMCMAIGYYFPASMTSCN
jgi:Copper type II ascorbate-dependent monooxygenase, C-terminal domain